MISFGQTPPEKGIEYDRIIFQFGCRMLTPYEKHQTSPFNCAKSSPLARFMWNWHGIARPNPQGEIFFILFRSVSNPWRFVQGLNSEWQWNSWARHSDLYLVRHPRVHCTGSAPQQGRVCQWRLKELSVMAVGLVVPRTCNTKCDM